MIVNYAADAARAESVASAIRPGGGRAAAVRADVAEPGDIANMFDWTEHEIGPLAALVNNAGIVGERVRVEREADELSRLTGSRVTANRLRSSCEDLGCGRAWILGAAKGVPWLNCSIAIASTPLSDPWRMTFAI